MPSHFFSVSLVRDMSVLLIFSKNQLLKMDFQYWFSVFSFIISVFIFIIPSPLLNLGLSWCFSTSLRWKLNYWFETFTLSNVCSAINLSLSIDLVVSHKFLYAITLFSLNVFYFIKYLLCTWVLAHCLDVCYLVFKCLEVFLFCFLFVCY